MLKDRISAGVKIIGVYFLFVGLEKVLSLSLSLFFLREESRQASAYLGQAAASMSRFAIPRQSLSFAAGALFYLLAALLCLKATSWFVRICAGAQPDGTPTGK